MNPMNVPKKMLGGYNPQGRGRIDLSPVLAKLKQTEMTAKQLQARAGNHFNFAPLLRKLKEAEAVGYALQQKARSGNL